MRMTTVEQIRESVKKYWRMLLLLDYWKDIIGTWWRLLPFPTQKRHRRTTGSVNRRQRLPSLLLQSQPCLSSCWSHSPCISTANDVNLFDKVSIYRFMARPHSKAIRRAQCCQPVSVCLSVIVDYSLRSRTPNNSLISKTSHLSDRDFVVRMLCKNSY